MTERRFMLIMTADFHDGRHLRTSKLFRTESEALDMAAAVSDKTNRSVVKRLCWEVKRVRRKLRPET